MLKGFGRNSPLTLCEQKFLYENTLQLPERHIKGENKALIKFGKLHSEWSESTRTGKGIKVECTE